MPTKDLAILRATVHFIRYGKSVCPRKLVFAGDDSDATAELVWGFYVVKMDGRIILVDCGFQDKALAEKYGVVLTDPFASLAWIGVEPKMVNDIVITHHHFDHTENIPRFPRARIIIQREEYELYRRELPDHSPVASTQLRRFDDECDLDGILQLRRIGGHTPGCTEVSFMYHGRTYIIPGDECYMLDNYLQRNPIGFAQDTEANRKYIASLPHDIVLLPFHDPQLLAKYPADGDNAIMIVPE